MQPLTFVFIILFCVPLLNSQVVVDRKENQNERPFANGNQ